MYEIYRDDNKSHYVIVNLEKCEYLLFKYNILYFSY